MAKRTEAHSKAVNAVNDAYLKKDTVKTDRLEQLLFSTKDLKLPKELQEILDGFNDNPLEGVEKELYGKIEDIEFPIEALGDKVDDFSAIDVSVFSAELAKKISSFKDSKGIYKAIPILDEIGIPKTSLLIKLKKSSQNELDTLTELQTEMIAIQSKANSKIESGDDSYLQDIEEIKSLGEQVREISEKLKKERSKIMEISKKASQWEKDLVNEYIVAFMTATNNRAFGKPADFTPYSRYLGN